MPRRVSWFGIIGGWIFSISTGVIANLLTAAGFPQSSLGRAAALLFSGRLAVLLMYRPVWLLLKFIAILAATAVGMSIIALLWGGALAHKDLSERQKIAASALVAVLLSLLAVKLIAEGFYVHTSQEVAILCKQCAQLGPCAVSVYANNGAISYNVTPTREPCKQREPCGPVGYARITLQTYMPDEEHAAGWIIFLPPGHDLSRWKQLRFWVRGAKGGEKVGVKMKDSRGTEVPVPSLGDYVVKTHGIANLWQEVSIPLDAFPRVDFGLMDNLSFFVNGRTAGTAEPQTIFIGDLKWEEQ
jgi:hypothetical protein